MKKCNLICIEKDVCNEIIWSSIEYIVVNVYVQYKVGGFDIV